MDLTFYNSMGYTHLCGTQSVLKLVKTMTLYDQADMLCRNEGANLARPRTSSRWKCMADYVEPRATGVHVWMDITDKNAEGTFVFSDNTPVPLPHYWLPNEPYPPSAPGADCVGIWPSWKQWDDLPCSNGAYYLCEIEF
ncbi:collectin-10-like [Pecten maximus]|uniref:collectin-10-like n=1 Tax=Pecten maximus TaxID=6579 RepID=UPI0014586756|nr:collectin-10-like [Pecten maximus]